MAITPASQMLYDLLKIAIIVIGAFLAYHSFYYYAHVKGPWVWIKLVYALVGLYWSALYTYILIAPPGCCDPQLFGMTYVRGPLLITLAVMSAGSLMSYDRVRAIEEAKKTNGQSDPDL